MSDVHRTYEIRCPVYGFVTLNDWEREIIDHPAFQRLRRIRQLGWSEYIYPGATHTRFEHSLGVMHMASLVYDSIVANSRDVLEASFGYKEGGLERHKRFVRLAALLHDVGHSPFSHASEELFPKHAGDQQRYKHEDYSAAIIREKLADVIDNHPLNRTNWDIKASDIAAVIEGTSQATAYLFWKDLISGQMDADRMDYLLRDSLHTGVGYGRYDWQRLVNTVRVIPSKGSTAPRIGIDEGGWHAAEALILARYFMFTQVYFHKTRVAYDHHIRKALQSIMPNGQFAVPNGREIDDYLEWDDWKVLGRLANGEGGEHGQRIHGRNHFREIRSTKETPGKQDFANVQKWKKSLGRLLAAEESAEKSWYKIGPTDIQIMSKDANGSVEPLSVYSSVVRSIRPIRKVLLFVRPEDRDEAGERLEGIK